MSPTEFNYRPILQQLLKNGDESSLKEATELAVQWIAEDASNPMAFLQSGEVFRKASDFFQALSCYTQAADLYASLGKTVQCLGALKIALELDPESKVIRERLEAMGGSASPAKTPASSKTSKIPETPLFSALPPNILQALLLKLKRLTLEDQAFVCKEGDPGDSIYVLTQGRAVVRIYNPDASFRDVATLEEGAFFGEFAYFSQQKRTASVQALGSIEILEIERRVLDGLVKSFPDVNRVLQEFYQQRLIDSLVARSDLFGCLKPEDRRDLIQLFTPQKSASSSLVLLEGDPGDTFFFIQSGEVEVFREKAGKKVLLARLSGGDFFGELALLTNHRRTASVRAVSDCNFLTLKRENAEEIFKRHPDVFLRLQEIAQARMATTKPAAPPAKPL